MLLNRALAAILVLGVACNAQE